MRILVSRFRPCPRCVCVRCERPKISPISLSAVSSWKILINEKRHRARLACAAGKVFVRFFFNVIVYILWPCDFLRRFSRMICELCAAKNAIRKLSCFGSRVCWFSRFGRRVPFRWMWVRDWDLCVLWKVVFVGFFHDLNCIFFLWNFSRDN